jgi:hypothetical protein
MHNFSDLEDCEKKSTKICLIFRAKKTPVGSVTRMKQFMLNCSKSAKTFHFSLGAQDP